MNGRNIPTRYVIHAHDAVQAMGIFVGAFPICKAPLAVQVEYRYKMEAWERIAYKRVGLIGQDVHLRESSPN